MKDTISKDKILLFKNLEKRVTPYDPGENESCHRYYGKLYSIAL